MKEILTIIIAILLFGVVVLAGVWALRSIVREIERQNEQHRLAIEAEKARKEAIRKELFEWHDRVSAGWGRL